MSRIIIITFLVCIVYDSFNTVYIQEDFKGQYVRYKSIYEMNCNKKLVHSKKFIIKFNPGIDKIIPDLSEAVGLCLKMKNGDQIILLNKEFWNQSTENEKEELVFHEMSHCVLDLDHTNDENNYMYPYIRESLTRAELYNQVTNDIKNNCSR